MSDEKGFSRILQRGSSKQIRVSVENRDGDEFIVFRGWKQSEAGTWQPQPAGFTFERSEFEGLCADLGIGGRRRDRQPTRNEIKVQIMSAGKWQEFIERREGLKKDGVEPRAAFRQAAAEFLERGRA